MQQVRKDRDDFDKGDFISPKQAAEILFVSRSQIYSMIHNGILKAYKMGRLHRILRSDLSEFIKTNEFHSTI